MKLSGKVAIITGGARGIGNAIATKFAAEGAHIAIFDLLDEEGLASRDRLREQRVGAEYFHVDVSDEGSVISAVGNAVEIFGGVDVVVSNAGFHRPAVIHEMSVDDYDKTLGVHARGLFLLTKHAAPHLLRAGGGSIIAISSIQALMALPGRLGYAAAKGAISASIRQIAVEYGPFGIRANAILPGAIMTDLNRRRHEEEISTATFEELKNAYPLRRYGTPADIANAAAFLASEEASWITGVDLPVDGGVTKQLAESNIYAPYAQYWDASLRLIEDGASF